MNRLAALLFALSPVPVVAQELPASQQIALEAAARDLCPARIAMLGESATHGDGATFAFKAALARRLVERCGFDAVLFEAGSYDLLALHRAFRDRRAAPEMLFSGVGEFWSADRAVRDLLVFLFDRALAGRITLGGLDHQLGSRGAWYSLNAMAGDLTAAMPRPRREECGATLKSRILFDYPAGYSNTDRAAALACLREVDGSLTRLAPGARRDELRWMTADFRSFVEADRLSPADAYRARDRAMFRNLQRFTHRLRPDAKIVVWGATVHLAKTGKATAPFVANFGSLVHRAYGDRAFSLGFSAAGGFYRHLRRPDPRPVATPPPTSIEARVLADTRADAVYLDRARLATLKSAPAAVFRHREYVSLRWSDALDGLVVFREERPSVDALTQNRGQVRRRGAVHAAETRFGATRLASREPAPGGDMPPACR